MVYMCEQLLVMRHVSDFTCESAIFWQQPPGVLKELCNFQFYPSLIPDPTVLDSGT